MRQRVRCSEWVALGDLKFGEELVCIKGERWNAWSLLTVFKSRKARWLDICLIHGMKLKSKLLSRYRYPWSMKYNFGFIVLSWYEGNTNSNQISWHCVFACCNFHAFPRRKQRSLPALVIYIQVIHFLFASIIAYYWFYQFQITIAPPENIFAWMYLYFHKLTPNWLCHWKSTCPSVNMGPSVMHVIMIKPLFSKTTRVHMKTTSNFLQFSTYSTDEGTASP